MDNPFGPEIRRERRRYSARRKDATIAPRPAAAERHFTLHWGGPSAAARDAAIDLTGLAGELAPGESLSVSFRASGVSGGGGAASEVRLTLAARGLMPGKAGAADLRPGEDVLLAAIRAAFPGCIAAPTASEHPADTLADGLPIRLPARRIDLGGDGFRQPPRRGARAHGTLAQLEEASLSVALPGTAPAGIDLGAGLAGCLASGRCFQLRLTLTAFTLSPEERAMARHAASLLRGDAEALMQDPAGFQARSRDSALLAAWAGTGTGFRLALALDVYGEMGDRLFLQRLLTQAFGPQTVDPEAEPAPLDLSTALPRALSLRDLLPPVAALRGLGFLGLAEMPQRGGTLRWSRPQRLGTDLGGQPVTVPRDDLGRHMVILGATGTGKSTLICRMVRADIDERVAGIVIDPHGDLCRDLSRSYATGPHERVVLADLAADPDSLGLDLLATEDDDPLQGAHRVANDLTEIFQRVMFRDSLDSMGPMWASYFRNALSLLILGAHGQGVRPDLCDFPRVFHDAAFRKGLLAACGDTGVASFWTGIAIRAGGEASLENIAPYIVSKMDALLGNPRLRRIVAGGSRSLDLGDIFDSRRTILVNLAKGSLGATDAALIGALISARVLRDLMARCARPSDERPPVRVTLDEFQTYATPALAQLMAEGRKTGAQITCCSQDLTSFGGSRPQPEVAGAILSNAAQLLAFRLGPRDANLLAEWFAPDLAPADLMRLPDRHFAARLMVEGMPQPVRIGRTLEER